jgi:hypothetical protein
MAKIPLELVVIFVLALLFLAIWGVETGIFGGKSEILLSRLVGYIGIKAV